MYNVASLGPCWIPPLICIRVHLSLYWFFGNGIYKAAFPWVSQFTVKECRQARLSAHTDTRPSRWMARQSLIDSDRLGSASYPISAINVASKASASKKKKKKCTSPFSPFPGYPVAMVTTVAWVTVLLSESRPFQRRKRSQFSVHPLPYRKGYARGPCREGGRGGEERDEKHVTWQIMLS